MLWAVRELYPGYFAFVMATGIVSVAALFWEQVSLSSYLLLIAIPSYLILVLLYSWRAFGFPDLVWQDLSDPRKAFSFLTFVAATNVLASRLLTEGAVLWAQILWWVGVIGWLVLMYAIFAILMTCRLRSSQQALNGSWLVAVVATQSVVIVAVDLAPYFQQPTLIRSFAWLGWALGIVLYVLFVGWILKRYLFEPVVAADLSPTDWINMGAAAISALAGTRLWAATGIFAADVPLASFTQGVTLLLWAWGSWWIPLLVILGIWKYGVGRQSLAYNPAFWSVVFPLGMYCVVSHELAEKTGWTLFSGISYGFLWLAAAAWTATLCSMLWAWGTSDGLRLKWWRTVSSSREVG